MQLKYANQLSRSRLHLVLLDGCGAHGSRPDGRRSIQVEIECELSFCVLLHSVAKPPTHYTRSIIIPPLAIPNGQHLQKETQGDRPTEDSYPVSPVTDRQSERGIGDKRGGF